MSIATDLANDFGNFANGASEDEIKEFLQKFSNQHRTIQQSMVRIVFRTIESVASPDYRKDLRNNESHEVCKKLIKGYKEGVGKEFASERYQNKLKPSDERFLASDFCLPSKRLPSI